MIRGALITRRGASGRAAARLAKGFTHRSSQDWMCKMTIAAARPPRSEASNTQFMRSRERFHNCKIRQFSLSTTECA